MKESSVVKAMEIKSMEFLNCTVSADPDEDVHRAISRVIDGSVEEAIGLVIADTIREELE